MGTEAPDATSEVVIDDPNDSLPDQVALIKHMQRDQARQTSELFSRIEALTQALTTNIVGQKRAAQPENLGSKRKIARSNDESNGRQGNSLSAHTVTRVTMNTLIVRMQMGVMMTSAYQTKLS